MLHALQTQLIHHTLHNDITTTTTTKMTATRVVAMVASMSRQHQMKMTATPMVGLVARECGVPVHACMHTLTLVTSTQVTQQQML